ncbi:MAG TPA: OmpH family outer membrane protein [Anaeromyxobacteraceae bacterium]
MRTTVLSLVAALALGAAPGHAHAEGRIAFVDLQRALNSVDEGKAAKESLKREFDQKQKLLDDKKTEFDRLRQDFEKQSVVMSDDARKQKQGELERKGMELQSFFVQLQKELSEREREATRGIFDKMHVLVREIAEQEGVSVVVGAEALVYADPALDLTNELVRKYNARHKATAANGKKAEVEKKKGSKKEGK